MTPAAALHLLEQAERSHKRAHWRLAARALGELVSAQTGAERATSPVEPRISAALPEAVWIPESAPARPAGPVASILEEKPRSLIQFLADAGIRDPGGELLGRDLDKWHRGKAFRRRLVRDDGALSLEEAADRAYEAGFFPDVPAPRWESSDNMHPVTTEMLIGALEAESNRDFTRLYPEAEETWQ